VQAVQPACPAYVIGYPKMSSSLPNKERIDNVNGYSAFSKKNPFGGQHCIDGAAVDALSSCVTNQLVLMARSNPHVGSSYIDQPNRKLYGPKQLASENIRNGQLLNASNQQNAYNKQAEAAARADETMLARARAKDNAAIEAAEANLLAIDDQHRILEEELFELDPRKFDSTPQQKQPLLWEQVLLPKTLPKAMTQAPYLGLPRLRPTCRTSPHRPRRRRTRRRPRRGSGTRRWPWPGL